MVETGVITRAMTNTGAGTRNQPPTTAIAAVSGTVLAVRRDRHLQLQLR